jgi:hypothetical protein
MKTQNKVVGIEILIPIGVGLSLFLIGRELNKRQTKDLLKNIMQSQIDLQRLKGELPEELGVGVNENNQYVKPVYRTFTYRYSIKPSKRSPI